MRIQFSAAVLIVAQVLKELVWFYYSLKNGSPPIAQFSEKLNAFKY